MTQKKQHAFCYASGEIVFSTSPIPDGTLPIRLNATPQEVRKIKVLSRLSYDGKTLLVPGIPEAAGEHSAYEAFSRFVKTLDFKTPASGRRRRKQKGSV